MGVLSYTKKILEVKCYAINSLCIKQYYKELSVILKTSKQFHVLRGNHVRSCVFAPIFFFCICFWHKCDLDGFAAT